jgi:hypothetical protein
LDNGSGGVFGKGGWTAARYLDFGLIWFDFVRLREIQMSVMPEAWTKMRHAESPPCLPVKMGNAIPGQ